MRKCAWPQCREGCKDPLHAITENALIALSHFVHAKGKDSTPIATATDIADLALALSLLPNHSR